jgi:hypothetical protein
MSEPWNFTEAQRRQFREAHAEAKRKSIDELLHDPGPESEADREAVREDRAVAEHRCPYCLALQRHRCRTIADGTLLDHPHPARVRLVKEG